ncbi:flavin reductase (DIM6/NTAB) family NADH-FMN oxidoreductase RutF [Arthrobacter bambusae]|uniref:Flavin reductase (DIM6/NTAB) family NADH-FMN oxidoreductase RutF n=1 Tax=Arthrobacter bambusae TaxID=1338426 RepID=A0ABV2P1A6_9MICC
MSTASHIEIKPSVLYVGTPVMLISTENADGSTNLSPASSYWSLGQMLVLGLLADGQTAANLTQRPGLTVNFPHPKLWQHVEAIADTTGATPVSAAKAARYVHEKDKFGCLGLTPQASELVTPPRVQECALQFEAMVRRTTSGVGDYLMVEAEVLRVYASPEIVVPGTNHVNPQAWEPTIYSFRHYFGLGTEHGFRPTSDTAALTAFSPVP